MNHRVANKRVTTTTTNRDSVIFFLLKRYAFGVCLDLVFGPIWDFLCVVGGARSVCNHRWLHTRWCFSLVSDPIIYAVPCGSRKGTVETEKRFVYFSQNEAHDNSRMSKKSPANKGTLQHGQCLR